MKGLLVFVMTFWYHIMFNVKCTILFRYYFRSLLY